MISVVIITYQQEKYIRETLEGVLMQEGIPDDGWEIIISNDHSSDSTHTVISEVIENHPKRSLIRYYNQEENLGMMRNFIWTLQQTKGEFIAICEGDDFWTDPFKLKKQVEFLKQHEKYAMCYTNTPEIDAAGNITSDSLNSSESDAEYTIRDLAKGNFIHTCSVVFRNHLFDYQKLENYLVGDYPLYLFLAEKGSIYYMEKSMAVYRTEIGSWSSIAQKKRLDNWLIVLNQLMTDFRDNTDVYKLLKEQEKATKKSRFKSTTVGRMTSHLSDFLRNKSSKLKRSAK